MSNELLLILCLVCTYMSVLLFYRFFGKTGLYVWTAIVTISANIEVLMLIDAFGVEQTLGNILFASSFLVTDILSENEDKESANLAVKIGIMSNITFVLISQSWLLFTPNANDWVSPAVHTIFSNTPRLMIVGVLVYALAQWFDVWAYHLIWEKTKAKFGDSKRGLWLRNNGSTLVSQLLNTVLFTFGAFIGMYDIPTLINITIASYVIYVITSLCDTPVVYLSRKIKPKN
ncbi:queuosine precursor transporter [Tannockella kyphosi]|uniref:queuosine precursor transporter n=1 Tax=Tannockella kyphosi TaxID=2899121 RepID=UPI00201344A1|nr:queuosine precursor transporter [Tannockella kyphosi]